MASSQGLVSRYAILQEKFYQKLPSSSNSNLLSSIQAPPFVFSVLLSGRLVLTEYRTLAVAVGFSDFWFIHSQRAVESGKTMTYYTSRSPRLISVKKEGTQNQVHKKILQKNSRPSDSYSWLHIRVFTFRGLLYVFKFHASTPSYILTGPKHRLCISLWANSEKFSTEHYVLSLYPNKCTTIERSYLNSMHLHHRMYWQVRSIELCISLWANSEKFSTEHYVLSLYPNKCTTIER